MQFHTNGFQAGDPDIHPAADLPAGSADQVDVLIVGCGPAGLTLAAQLAGHPEIRTKIVERKDGPMEKGQADGISCRSMEMFQTFGIAEKIKREACWVNETTFWNPDPANPQQIQRTGRIQDVEDGLSEMPHVILNQARVHDRYLEIMRNSATRLEPDYDRKLTDLTIDRSADYPVTVTLERSDAGHEGEVETVQARYVVGCDGARSAVRNAIGRKLHGDRANQAWGVMDVLAVTDFPDFRMKSLVKSAGEGNILFIPREGGHLVRVYIEMDKLRGGKPVSTKDVTVDQLIQATNNVLHPFTMDVKEVAWWSIYEVGHSVTDKFDDVPAELVDSQLPCVFIAGDACHTHSAKAGQGMNVSMGDTFNLGWKLISVLKGRSAPELLHSYSAERQSVAQDLIDFDHEWSRIIGAPAKAGEDEGEDMPKFQRYFIEHGRFTAGITVKYRPSALTGNTDHQDLAPGFEIGTRLHSAPVIRLGDAKPMQLGHVIEADARWRLFAFAGTGDPTAKGTDFAVLCDYLANNPASPILRYTPKGADLDSVIDLRAVFQQYHRDLDMMAFPEILMPPTGRLGLRDYEKMYCVDARVGDIFDMRSIDRKAGCLVIVRPDQHVADIMPLTDFARLGQFFDGILLEPQD